MTSHTIPWSERSKCAARAALQTDCVANVVATVNTVIFSSFAPLQNTTWARAFEFGNNQS